MDRSTYAELFASEYMGPMFYYCLKKTGNKNDAEELASDIALAVIHAIANYPPPEYFSAWVWRVAHNRYVRWCKDRCLHREHIAGEDIGEFDIADGEAPEDAVIEAEQYSLLRRELAFVAKEHRLLVAAHYLDGIGVSELANRLGMPVGTVKTRLFKARKILKEGMDMAREFGKRSYAPEDVGFVASGNQPDGLPWSAVNRMIPKNILLEANNNPSTAEELAMELGIALPYMEEEIEILEKATLLKEMDDGRHITNFFIADKECQLEVYNVMARHRQECTALLCDAVKDNFDTIRDLINPTIPEKELEWGVYLYIIDRLLFYVKGVGINGYFKRPNKGDWGFMGQELHNLISDRSFVNHNLSLSKSCSWGQFAVVDMGFQATYIDSVTLNFIGEILKNERRVDSFNVSENEIWKSISGKYVHAAADGTVIPDMIVFRDGAEKKMMELISSHPSAVKLKEQLGNLFAEIREVLKRRSNPVLHETLDYYVTTFMFGVRGMLINDAVASGVLTVPDDPAKSNAGMYLIIK